MITMRALVVTNMWPTADDLGFGVFVREQVEAVRNLGIAVDVHFMDGRASRLNYLRAVPAVRRRLARGSYDLVHAHYVLAGLVAWLAGARRPGRPLVVTHHGVEVFAGWQAPIARWLTTRADRTLVISRDMARHLGLGREAVLPCGVDTDLFRPGSPEIAREDLNLPANRVLVAWIGADRPEKRLWLAEATVDRLRQEVPNVELLVVTGQPHEEVPRYLQAANVLLVTSRWEGGPLVVKEALACDVPVVSTDVGDVRDLLADLRGCAVVEDTPDALANGLMQAIDHGPVAGRPRIAAHASDRTAQRLVGIYEDTLA